MANFDPPSYRPAVSHLSCGCVVTEVYGHTHLKFCATCKAAVFERIIRRAIDSVESNNLDLIGG